MKLPAERLEEIRTALKDSPSLIDREALAHIDAQEQYISQLEKERDQLRAALEKAEEALSFTFHSISNAIYLGRVVASLSVASKRITIVLTKIRKALRSGCI